MNKFGFLFFLLVGLLFNLQGCQNEPVYKSNKPNPVPSPLYTKDYKKRIAYWISAFKKPLGSQVGWAVLKTCQV